MPSRMPSGASGLDQELCTRLVDALEMRGDNGDRWNPHEALQDAAGSELDPMLERKHLLKRHAGRRVMDLLAVRLAEIPSEGRARRRRPPAESPCRCQDGPILIHGSLDDAGHGLIASRIKRTGSLLRGAVAKRRDIRRTAGQHDAVQTPDDRAESTTSFVEGTEPTSAAMKGAARR